MDAEKSLTTYSPEISGKLAQVSNRRCTQVNSESALFCARLDNSFMQVFDMTNPQGTFLQYTGPVTGPYRPEGVDSHLEAIAIFSVNPVAVKISNFTDGKVFNQWTKPYTATVFTMADVKNGILLVVRQGVTEITNLKTG